MTEPKKPGAPRKKAAARPDGPGDLRGGTLEGAVGRATAAADWITGADAAATELALKLARDLDQLGADDAGQVASLARTFLTALGALGLTVAGRTATNTTAPSEEDPLDALRARAAARLTEATAGDAATVRTLPRR